MRSCSWVALVAATVTATTAACSDSTEAGPPEALPAAGEGLYDVDFIGANPDTTFTYRTSAITYQRGCIQLQTLPGQDAYLGATMFRQEDGARPSVREYRLRGLTTPDEPGTMIVYSIYNGYSSAITGSINILYATEDLIGGTFDFSAPTEGRDPNFTVRIHGAFLAEDHSDSTETC